MKINRGAGHSPRIPMRKENKKVPPVRAAKNMAKKYQKPASTGREYVDAVRERS